MQLNILTNLYRKALFKGFKHMLREIREPSTQMLSPAKKTILRFLMGDMLNGGAPVYAYSNHLFLKNGSCCRSDDAQKWRCRVSSQPARVLGGWSGMLLVAVWRLIQLGIDLKWAREVEDWQKKVPGRPQTRYSNFRPKVTFPRKTSVECSEKTVIQNRLKLCSRLLLEAQVILSAWSTLVDPWRQKLNCNEVFSVVKDGEKNFIAI